MTSTQLGPTPAHAPRDSESRIVDLDDLLENGAVGLHWLAPDGTILWANRVDYERLGYQADEYIGHRIGEFHTDAAVRDELERKLATGDAPRSLEATLRCRDGTQRIVALTTSARFDDQGRLLHTRCVSQDVTEQRRAEAELRASQRALDLLRSVSSRLSAAELGRTAMFGEVARDIADFFGDCCGVQVLSSDGDWLELRGFHHREAEARELANASLRRAPAWQGVSGRVLRGGQTMRLSTLDRTGVQQLSLGAEAQAFFERFPFGSLLSVPLEAHGKVRGTLLVARARDEGYSDADERLLRQLAERMAVAVLLAEQHMELAAERQRLHALSDEARTTTGQLQMIADTLPALVAYIGRDLRYRFVNAAYETWFGLPREQIVSTNMRELLGPAGFEAAGEHVERALAGESVTFEGAMTYPRFGRRSVRAMYVPHRDDAGEIEGFVALVNDMSSERESTRARDELLNAEQEARARLAVLQQASDVLSRSLDYERTLESVTELVLPLLGDFGFFDVRECDGVRRIARAHGDAAVEKLLARVGFEASEPVEPVEPVDVHVSALTSGRSALHKGVDQTWLRNVARDDQHLAVLQQLDIRSMITVPLTYQGDTLGSLTLFFGSSRREHSEADLALAEAIASRAAAAVVNARLFKEARDAIGVRDDFLSMAGHELRTPLTALQLQILSITKVIGQPDGAEKVANRAEKASRNVLRLSNLVNELLDISRITAGRLKLERIPLDLVEAVRDVIARHSAELAKNECEVLFCSEGSVPGVWDPMRVEQIATNLITNAIKYGKGKPVEIKVERAEGIARLIVRDHGIGIPAEDQQRIFQRFERAVSSRHFGGLGFGLWIARQLVDAHGGNIRVTSESGRGATFEVELPLQPPDEVQA